MTAFTPLLEGGDDAARFHAHSRLASAITRSASKQTYFTVRLLADRDHVASSYRAYAYFRWVDDQLDEGLVSEADRTAFMARQADLLKRLSRGEDIPDLAPEECLLAEMIHPGQKPGPGLRAYTVHMMAVMAFDAERRGRLITAAELDRYTEWLAVAVTEALHHHIGHRCGAPEDETRYHAAAGAHIAHMLRDTLDDLDAGYYNIPAEALEAGGITARDIDTEAYREWVKERVAQARESFRIGHDYLSRVKCFRCRLAGYAYIARFELVLDLIERDGFLLRREYPECRTFAAGARTCLATLIGALKLAPSQRAIPTTAMGG